MPSHKVPVPDLAALARRQFDLLVVGGGIHGCGIARDAARRGLRVCLLEREDFAGATSSASSKLVHGGLRYLEQLRLGLVRESLRERSTLLRIAPHLVRPLPFLLPVYRGQGRPRWMLKLGLLLYDLLATGHSLGRHRWLSREEALAAEPGLDPQGLQGAFRYLDAQMDDARLCLENALDAREHGAELWNDFEALDLLEANGRVVGVRARNRRDGQEVELRAQVVVNAAGPWYRRVGEKQELARATGVRLSRGTHVVVGRRTRGHALLLQAQADGRVFFAIPWRGQTLLGTTDVEYEGDPAAVRPTRDEVDYLLREAGRALGGEPIPYEEVLAQFSGLRTLADRGGGDIGRLSREVVVEEISPGLLGVVGGKWTTYRATAERAVDMAARRIDRRDELRPCDTASAPLPGGDVPDMDDYFHVAEEALRDRYPLDGPQLRYLLGQYGARHTQLLALLDAEPDLAEPLEPGLPFLTADVVHAARQEWARNLDDLLWRRTWRAHLGPLDEVARARWQAALDRA